MQITKAWIHLVLINSFQTAEQVGELVTREDVNKSATIKQNRTVKS